MRSKPDFAEIQVRLTPRSSQNRIAVDDTGAIKAWVSAPPVDGAANLAVCALFADALKVAKSSVQVVGGSQSRDKRLRIEGLDSAEVMARLRT